MALAYSYGAAHIGFGLGFLNLLGMVLFFGLVLVSLKMLFRRARYSSGGQSAGDDCSAGWGSKHKELYNRRFRGNSADEAMTTARERLANSELSTDEFEVIKEGLKASTYSDPETWQRVNDEAMKTARMRFAKGELTLEEFEAVVKALLE